MFNRGLVAAFVLLVAVFSLVTTPAVRASTQMIFTVRFDLTTSPPKALNEVTGNPMSQADVQVVNPDDASVHILKPMDMAGNSISEVWFVEQNTSNGEAAWSTLVITQTTTLQPWNQTNKRYWIQADRLSACATAERLDENFACDPVQPSVRQVRIIVSGDSVTAIDDATGQIVDATDPRAVNPDDRESKLLGTAWIVGLEIDDMLSPPLRRVTVNFVDGTEPTYGVSEVAPGKFQGTRVWGAANEADAQAEAWRLRDSLGQLNKLYLAVVSAQQ